MTDDPRDVEAAVRAYCVAHAVSRDIFDQTGLSPDRSTILAARYAREAAEARTVEGVDPDLVAVREIVASCEFDPVPLSHAAKIRAGEKDDAVAVRLALAAYKAGKEARHG